MSHRFLYAAVALVLSLASAAFAADKVPPTAGTTGSGSSSGSSAGQTNTSGPAGSTDTRRCDNISDTKQRQQCLSDSGAGATTPGGEVPSSHGSSDNSRPGPK